MKSFHPSPSRLRLESSFVRIRDLASVLGSASAAWNNDNALRLSAALAYYAIFSMAPLLVLGISIAGLLFGEQAAHGQIAEQIREIAGDQPAQAIQGLLASVHGKTSGILATTISLVVMFFGASGVFLELQGSINLIWGIKVATGRPIHTLLRERFTAFAMVLGIGALLVVSLLTTTLITAVETYLHDRVALPAGLLHGIDFAFSFAIVTVLFAAIFKVLPRTHVPWRDVWTGASFTAFLFNIGKVLIGLYLGASSITSYYGAAGSAMVVLIWVYYSACILFFGVEFTKAYSLWRSEPRPQV